jgi:hypothetical protein
MPPVPRPHRVPPKPPAGGHFDVEYQFPRTGRALERPHPDLDSRPGWHGELRIHHAGVGDVHQPLHDEDDHDRGGNEVAVTWAGWHTNLHHVWDSGLVRVAGRDPEALAEQLDSDPPAIATSGTPADWANEAHALAPGAYRLPHSHRLERSSRYIRRKVPVVDLQIERAGLRLATLLNEVLGD